METNGSKHTVRAVTRNEWDRILEYICCIKAIDSGDYKDLKWDDFEDVGNLRDRNPDVDDYITLVLRLYSHEKSIKAMEIDRLKLSRRVLSLQKGFIDGLGGAKSE